jgi:small subunit ribosomal protein S9
MSEETPDEQTPEVPDAESEPETPETPEPAAEQESDPAVAGETPPAEDPPAEEPPAGEPPAEEPPVSEPVEEEPPVAAERPKAAESAPGADLEPIALEPERELDAEERARLEAEEEERRRLEAEAEASDEPVARSGPQVELSADQTIQATGKRKSSIARVIIRPGDGSVSVNGRTLDEYFPRQYLRSLARQPLVTAG